MASGQQDQYANDPGSAGHPPPHDPSRYPGYPPQTPTTGGYPHDHPSSARSGSFPYDAMRQPYPQTPGSTSGSMAPASIPYDPANEGARHTRSDHLHSPSDVHTNVDIPIDPAMSAVQSPTYPYYPSHDMGHYGAPGSAPPNYGPWPGYGQPGMAYSSPGAHSAVQSPASAGPPRGQVYSFVPIPGAQQHKRPRRRYEEIERMYKCGYNGCEKAYGTLNHLNAHVTMQGHGSKRTPEEFKEIRKEWKARKKEEENQRKADDERQRQASMSQSNSGQPGDNSTTGSTANSQTAPTPTTPGFPQSPRGPQLPPIGYNSTGNPYPGASGTAPDPSLYGNSQQGQNNYYSNYISRRSSLDRSSLDRSSPQKASLERLSLESLFRVSTLSPACDTLLGEPFEPNSFLNDPMFQSSPLRLRPQEEHEPLAKPLLCDNVLACDKCGMTQKCKGSHGDSDDQDSPL